MAVIVTAAALGVGVALLSTGRDQHVRVEHGSAPPSDATLAFNASVEPTAPSSAVSPPPPASDSPPATIAAPPAAAPPPSPADSPPLAATPPPATASPSPTTSPPLTTIDSPSLPARTASARAASPAAKSPSFKSLSERYSRADYAAVVSACSAALTTADLAWICLMAACHAEAADEAQRWLAANPAPRRAQLAANCKQAGGIDIAPR